MRGSTGPHRMLVRLNQSVTERALVGGKGASLSRLAALGAPVPTACAITTHAYTTFATYLGLPTTMASLSPADLPAIRSAVLESPLPDPVAGAIAEACEIFRDAAEPAPALAVRSSAPAEDGTDHSFAGLHDTVLDVRSPDEVAAAVRACWASLWSERALRYRHARGLDDEPAVIAVVIQQLVPADVSFVAFAADPVSGDDHVVISASWGLGEAIVSGLVTPDHLVVGRDGAVIDHAVGRKEIMIIPGERSGDGVRQVPVPRLMRQSPVMSAEQAAAIAALARSMSARLGYLADLEGGIAAGEIYLFQARPITTLTPQSTPADAAARGVPAGTPNRDLTFRPFPDSSGALH